MVVPIGEFCLDAKAELMQEDARQERDVGEVFRMGIELLLALRRQKKTALPGCNGYDVTPNQVSGSLKLELCEGPRVYWGAMILKGACMMLLLYSKRRTWRLLIVISSCQSPLLRQGVRCFEYFDGLFCHHPIRRL